MDSPLIPELELELCEELLKEYPYDTDVFHAYILCGKEQFTAFLKASTCVSELTCSKYGYEFKYNGLEEKFEIFGQMVRDPMVDFVVKNFMSNVKTMRVRLENCTDETWFWKYLDKTRLDSLIIEEEPFQQNASVFYHQCVKCVNFCNGDGTVECRWTTARQIGRLGLKKNLKCLVVTGYNGQINGLDGFGFDCPELVVKGHVAFYNFGMFQEQSVKAAQRKSFGDVKKMTITNIKIVDKVVDGLGIMAVVNCIRGTCPKLEELTIGLEFDIGVHETEGSVEPRVSAIVSAMDSLNDAIAKYSDRVKLHLEVHYMYNYEDLPEHCFWHLEALKAKFSGHDYDYNFGEYKSWDDVHRWKLEKSYSESCDLKMNIYAIEI